MPGHTRLARRGAVYYHRAAIPKDIADTYPKVEEVFSLKTKDYQEALRKVRIAAVEVDKRFEAHRSKLASETRSLQNDLSQDQITFVREVYYQHLLDEDEDTRLEGFFELGSSGGDAGHLPDTPRNTFVEYGEILKDAEAAARHLYAQGKSDAFWQTEAEEVLSWDGLQLRLSPSSPDWKRVIRALQEATISATIDRRRRQIGDVVATPHSPASVTVASSLLSQKVEEWIAEKSRADWGVKAEEDHQHWLAAFIEIVGDRPYTDYGKADGLRFKAVLSKLPANAKKVRAIRNMSLVEASEKAAGLGIEPMSITTYNKAMVRVGGFFKWAAVNSVEHIANPTEGLRLKDNIRARDKRNPISSDHLQALFSSPVWRSCRSDRFAAQPGDVVMTSHWKFWLPLLGLWTGARSNELGQLLVSDIKQEDGVDYLHVIDDAEGKSAKTDAGRRKIPIHDQLKALGFMQLVADRQNHNSPGDRLFPDLRVGAKGYYSDTVTKFFSPYMETIGIKTSKTSFHSLRHNFQDACRKAKVYPGHRETIAGREEGGVGGAYGGEEYEITELNGAVQSIRYAAVDWSALPTYRCLTSALMGPNRAIC